MKLREASILIALGIIAVVSAIGYFSHKKLENDNIVEQGAEEVVESITGVEVDFTPEEETGGFIQSINWEKFKQFLPINEEE